VTKEERWRAAIEEAKPLLEALKAIRDKYKLYSINVLASRYPEMKGPFSQIQVFEDWKTTSLGDMWEMSFGGGEWLDPYYHHMLKDEDDAEALIDTKEEVE
jgi:hypothetical protein